MAAPLRITIRYVALCACVSTFLVADATSDIRYKTLSIRQDVDHLSLANQDTFLQRYLLDDRYFDQNGAPIFFYTGGESDILMFCENTGLMFDWAPAFRAMVVCAEHRYYGRSLPYGNDSFKDLAHLGYLTMEQALADYVVLIDHLRTTIPGAEHSPVISFGGSYGGVLAAFIRKKYPHMVLGALASSAPIWQSIAGCNAHKQFVTNIYREASSNCERNIRKSWKIINRLGQTENGLKRLSHLFTACHTIENLGNFKLMLKQTYEDLAMVNYPIATNFAMPLPAWPVKSSCAKLEESQLDEQEIVEGVAFALNTVLNYTGNLACLPTSITISEVPSFDFQHCSELIIPECTNGVTDMFEPKPWNTQQFIRDCQQKWFGVMPRTYWALGQNYGFYDLSASSNIIFSNGEIDPWSTGGLTSSLSESVVAIVIDGAAHHVDLRPATPSDSAALVQARAKEKAIITKWIEEYWFRKQNSPPLDIGGLRAVRKLPGRSETLKSEVQLLTAGEPSVKGRESVGRSGGWIAAAVVATVAGVGLVVMTVRFYRKRRAGYTFVQGS